MSCDKCKENHPAFTASNAVIDFTYTLSLDATGTPTFTNHSFDTTSSNLIFSNDTNTYTVRECGCECHDLCDGEDCDCQMTQ